MLNSTAYLDVESDELIQILIDSQRTRVEQTTAARQLYQLHASWVVQQVRKQIYNPDDVEDIAQMVWMQVLQPNKLSSDYKHLNGKFRAYLRAPIRWAILKHISKLPYSTNNSGEKIPAKFTDVTDAMLEESIDESILNEVIENIIKPNLKNIEIKSRNAYLLNEHPVIFEKDPSLSDVATINGILDSEAIKLFDIARQKTPDACSDEEISVYLPVEYKLLIDPVLLKKSSGSYLATMIGISDTAFRKRLHAARKYLLEIVRQNLFTLSGGANHG